MQNLKIGDTVVISATSDTEYIDGIKQVVSKDIEPRLAIITGQRRKMLGCYHRADRDNIWEEYEQAYLSVNGSVLLWETRKTLTSKPVLVVDEHIYQGRLTDILKTIEEERQASVL